MDYWWEKLESTFIFNKNIREKRPKQRPHRADDRLTVSRALGGAFFCVAPKKCKVVASI